MSVWKPDMDGKYLAAATETITGLSSPCGVAVASDHTVYVAEGFSANQVSVWKPDPNGDYLAAATQTITGFNSPSGVAVDSDHTVYVADYSLAKQMSVWKLGENGNYPTTATRTITGLGYPYGVAVDSDHTVYLAESNPERVSAWKPDTDGQYPATATRAITGLTGPAGVAVDSDRTIYVAEQGADRVSVWKLGADGEYGVNPTQMITGLAPMYGTGPSDVAVDSDHTLYITEYGNQQLSVWKLGEDGKYPTTATQTITGLNQAQGVAVDSDHTIYIAEYGQVSVWKLGEDGKYPTIATQTITGISHPKDVVVDSDHTIFVAESGVSVWKPDKDGEYPTTATQTIAPSGIPYYVALDSDRALYIAEYGSNQVSVRELGADGEYPTSATRTITGVSYGGMALDPDDTLYIVDGDKGLYTVPSPMHSVTGQVVSARGGDGTISTGTVSVVKPSDAGDGTYVTVAGPVDIEADGSFTIGRVLLGEDYRVQVDVDGYDTGYSDTFAVIDDDVALPGVISLTPHFEVGQAVADGHGIVTISPNPVSWKGTGTVKLEPEPGYSIGQVTDTAADGTVKDVTDQANAKQGVYEIAGVDQTHEIRVTFVEGQTVWGQVTDKDGVGVPGVEVTVVKPAGEDGSEQVVAGPAVTDGDGDYGVPKVPPGTGYQVQGSADGYGVGNSGLFDVDGILGGYPGGLVLDRLFTIKTVAGTTGTALVAAESVVEGASDQVVITPGAGFMVDKVQDAIGVLVTDVTDQLVENGDGTFTLTLTGIVADHIVYASFKPAGVGATEPGGTGPGGSTGTGTTPGGPGTTTPPPAGPTAVKVKAALGQATLVKGKSYKLVALAYTADGVTVPVTYKSSKTKIATVSASGKVKARKPGKAVVTITSGSQMAKVKVTVLKKRPSSAASKVKKVTVKLKKKLKRGQIVYLTPKLGPKTALAVKVTFKSTKKKVAAIDKAGRLQVLAKGKTVIKVKAGKVTKKLKLKVK
ncbi:MAG: Ig-like domain-containing protein [Bifidobacteriaceae bacterium]|nr:Ig-like domain-containing protein [Bifidobacteriaceae bacterium]